MAFTIGSGTFTNGSATVTGVTLTSGTLAYFASGTRMVVGVNPVVQEVEAIAAPTVTTITLRSAWTGTGGTYSFLANQTSEGLRDAVQAIRTNNTSLQSFIDSIDTAATANSVAQRTSNGSLNAVDVNATRLLTSGNVGVGGISSPAEPLSVRGNGNLVSLNYAADGGPARIAWKNVAGTSLWEIGGGTVIQQDELAISRQGTTVAYFGSSGNVGIGTSSPAVKLHVNGDVLVPSDGKIYGNAESGIRSFIEMYNASTGNMSIATTFPTASITFSTGSTPTERMRIDSSGNVLVGKTGTNTLGVAGHDFGVSGYVMHTRASSNVMYLNRTGTDGSVFEVYKDGTQVGSIQAHANGTEISFSGSGANTSGIFCSNGNSILSTRAGVLQDNTQDLGFASNRWAVVYAGTGSINTSDAREKTAVEEFTADELNAAKQLSKEIGTYKFLSAVAKKGDDARKHIGMTVQRAIEIMEANNLDPFAYGFICYDAWEEKTVDHPAVEAVEGKDAWTETVEHEAECDEDGEIIKEAWTEVIEHQAVEAVEAKDAYTEVVQEAGDRYSFRPDEMLFFIARGLEARIEALEG